MKTKILYTLLAVATIAFGCKKTEFDELSKGEALGSFASTAPANNTMLVLNSATPSNKVTFTWSAATPGVSTKPTYKLIAALKTGSLDAPFIEFPADNNGTATSLNLTQKQLDDALKAKAVADGAKVDLIWAIQATNGTVKVNTATMNISITRMGDGVSNFLLYGPVSSSTPVVINPNSTTDFLNFKWQKAFPGVTANAVKYQVKFVAKGGDFNNPIFTYTSNNSGLDSALAVGYKDISDKLTAAGYTDQATPVALQWTVEATSGNFKKTADYVNDLVITREVKMFLVGGDTPASWTAESALQMIPDAANPGTFYIYVKLNAGNGGLKFLNQQQWPGGSLNSSDWGMKPGSPGDALVENEVNIENYGPSGVYRVTFDSKNLKYYVQADHGQMGAVGSATVAGWNPPGVFPSQALSLIATNKFLGFVNLTSGQEWKMIDGNAWGNGSVSGSRDYGKGTTDGSMLETGESNFSFTGTTGLKRIVWDGTDIKNLKYSVTDGTVFLVGNATAGGWDNSPGNAALPAMTYQGNGKWTVTTNLAVGEFKFIFTKGNWDYNYGGAAGVIAEGGANIGITVAGNYTVVLDEYNRTYTLTKN
ncbi:SusF/SusE family outer membrane protein [Pedobacter sp. KR3-3]|uniref:SusF/SusE family outer membrane protein n=1 Tax=Pedobacter albus TaxID=3113905 RepID=A0ABU7I6F7_9SPHI|nr:SusF/SusE family outer membrane protein [Pedobacter sp. KR3-3]MEE1945045.1 SusF/SusE family outer membrane protein [Pedobacter sp. KR3-3]